MSAQKIGTVVSPSNDKTYDVKWSSSNSEVYVSYAGWSYVGKANSVDDALSISISWLAQNS